ncbi:hypothetical protein ACHAXT_004693 [Thalassiosira profunda]
MARRMLVWDDELYDSGMLNDAGSRDGEGTSSPSISTTQSPSALPPIPTPASSSLPRWRPSAIRQQSISNSNPSFRTTAPVMTNAGYAGILRRNSRKRSKPSMWRHALRVYSKMGELEKEAREVDAPAPGESEGSNNKGSQIPGVGNYLASIENAGSTTSSAGRRTKIRRSTAHHEAALVAASKLGMWEEALLIFNRVEKSALPNSTARRRRGRVTDNMILSIVSACVKGSKVKRSASPAPSDIDAGSESSNAAVTGNVTEASDTMIVPPPPSRPLLRELTVEERRKPLDMARDIILSMETKHDIPLMARHINPLASAYNRLGLRSEAAALINDQLEDRSPPPPTKRSKASKQNEKREAELTSENPGFEGVQLLGEWSDDDLDAKAEEEEFSDGYEVQQLNVHQLKSKDRASYALLVQGAAMEGDWVGAVKELQRMTDAGLHPNSRNLNSFSEVMERGCRPTGNGEQKDESDAYYYGGRRRRRSWKKKRDSIWLGNLR